MESIGGKTMETAQSIFLKKVREIQETCVYTNLDSDISESKLFELSFDVIVDILELIDGYHDMELQLIDKKTGQILNEPRNLHDLAADFLRE